MFVVLVINGLCSCLWYLGWCRISVNFGILVDFTRIDLSKLWV